MSGRPIPGTPRVISPSPTPSESREGSQDGYFGPVTRSATRERVRPQPPIHEEIDDDGVDDDGDNEDDAGGRARSKARRPAKGRKVSAITQSSQIQINGDAANGHLTPAAAASSGWNWRDLSRSPSPLGLIPIHRHWRNFVHRHEVPRKVLHVSIGFVTTWLYVSGVQTSSITPYLMGALIPIASIDYLRFSYPSINRLYVQAVGALMRETEYNGWNGVIWYLLGAWIVLGFFPKDIAVVGVLLLSWCDTAASTVGRAYGQYTPRIRKGKSLAGSLAAFVVGAATAAAFWGWLVPRVGPLADDIDWPFMYQGHLSLPETILNAFHLSKSQGTISGAVALSVMSVVTGFIASVSEVINLYGLDDNLTIPVLSGLGMWSFLRIFG